MRKYLWYLLLGLSVSFSLQAKVSSTQPYARAKATPKHEHILIIGDSLMRQIGTSLADSLRRKGYKVTNLAKSSTGLVNKSFYDWQQMFAQALKQDPKIKLIIAHFGANDTLALKVNGRVHKFYSKAWDTAYRQRLNQIVSQLKPEQSLIWLGLPCMKPTVYNQKMQHLNQIIKRYLTQSGVSHQISWIDTKALVCPHTTYTERVIKNGKSIRVRINDGIHFSTSGAKLIASKIEKKIDQQVYPQHSTSKIKHKSLNKHFAK